MVCRIVMPLSRLDRVKIMGKMIRELDLGSYQKEVLIVCDNKEISEKEIVESLGGVKCEIIFTGNEITHALLADKRRERIRDIWNLISDYMERRSELVLGIEDDGNFNSGDFLKIESTYKDRYVNTYCKCGFVSGVEAGRWGFKMIGGWQFLDKEWNHVRTIPYQEKGIVQVHSAGLYFFLSNSEVIRGSEFKVNFFGPDWNFGVDLCRKGYFNFVDYSVKIGHDNGVRVLEVDRDCVVLEYIKENENLWRRVEGKSVNVIL